MQTTTKITKIFWKRTYLFIEYESKTQDILSLVRLKKINRRNRLIINEHVLETKEIGENKKMGRGETVRLHFMRPFSRSTKKACCLCSRLTERLP